MAKLRKDTLRIFLIILYTAVAGCNSNEGSQNELQDLSILTNRPCEAPCWYNLVPDKSTKQEVLDTLAGLSFLNSASIRAQDSHWWGAAPEETVPATLIQADCQNSSSERCVEIILIDDKIKSITLFPYDRLTFDEIVNHFGEPDYISPSPYGAECLGCILEFIWVHPSSQIIAKRVDQRCAAGHKICKAIRDGEKIPKNLELERITYHGTVPAYLQRPINDYDIPYPGFSSP